MFRSAANPVAFLHEPCGVKANRMVRKGRKQAIRTEERGLERQLVLFEEKGLLNEIYSLKEVRV